MNKQELINYYENKLEEVPSDWKSLDVVASRQANFRNIIAHLKNLDEPEKPVVKKFVAEWFEKNKNDLTFAIYEAVGHSIKESEYKHYPDGFMEWIAQVDNNSIETLVKMKLFGYEVKKEQLYYVIINGEYLVLMFKNRKDHKFIDKDELIEWNSVGYQLTESEIKAIDERYWAFAVKVEGK